MIINIVVYFGPGALSAIDSTWLTSFREWVSYIAYAMAFAPFLTLTSEQQRYNMRGKDHLVYFPDDSPLVALLPSAFADGRSEGQAFLALPYCEYASCLADILLFEQDLHYNQICEALPSPQALTRILSSALEKGLPRHPYKSQTSLRSALRELSSSVQDQSWRTITNSSNDNHIHEFTNYIELWLVEIPVRKSNLFVSTTPNSNQGWQNKFTYFY